MSQSEIRRDHLNPSDLGTKEYWNHYYQNDLDNQDEDGEHEGDLSELESWFDDVGAPAKTLAFLTSDSFPLSPHSPAGSLSPSVLDVGTGNGSTLFSLRQEGGFDGPMVGVDYSEQSIGLARRLWGQLLSTQAPEEAKEMSFEVFDIIRDDPEITSWWQRDSNGFDLVLDKGTFDAISLSSETVEQPDGSAKKIFELYPARVATIVKPGGYFLITSCNWTQDEIIDWFTKGVMQDVLELFHVIKYPVFQFGGQTGQGVVSICFQKIDVR